jgi:HAD superfamily hydrolase (TIGR01490 family)
MRTAAFFDLDGTLIRGSANIPFALAAFRRGFVPPRDLARDLWNGAAFLVQGASDDRAAAVRERILRAVAGHPVADVVALGDDFLPGVAARVTPEARGLLADHARSGHDRIVVSATSQEIVERLAQRLGMEDGAGTRSEVVDGRYTGRLAGPFCYGAGKADVVRELAAARGYDLAACFAYSDSVSDLPMMEAVGHPVVVNPEPELRAVAAERGWPVVEVAATGWRRALARRGSPAAVRAA